MRRGWLGVHIQAVTEEIAETLGLKDAKGALVASVIKDGPAEKGDIKAGDVILIFDGKEVPEMRKLPRIVAATDVNKTVAVVVWRNDKKMTLAITVGELEERETKVASRSRGGKKEGEAAEKIEALGFTVAEVTTDLRERYSLDKDAKGVVVTAVDEGGTAAEKGIRPGDVIAEISQEEVVTPADIMARIKEARKSGRKSVLLLVEGQGGLRFIALRIETG